MIINEKVLDELRNDFKLEEQISDIIFFEKLTPEEAREKGIKEFLSFLKDEYKVEDSPILLNYIKKLSGIKE